MEDAGASPHSPPQIGDDNTYPITITTRDLNSTTSPSIDTDFPLLAHDVIRLIQCSRCSRPLRAPIRLPCGNTLCRTCLPPTRARKGISYPGGEARLQGFTCSWGKCAVEHCVEDCGADVLMTKLVDVFAEVLENDTDNITEERDGWPRLVWDDYRDGYLEVKSADLRRGLLRGIYDLTKHGTLDYDASEVSYEDKRAGRQSHEYDSNEQHILAKLKEAVRNELDCHVCYSLIVDPLTTPCGHTFCRSCVAMVLKHTDLCPTCRRKLNMPSAVQSQPLNIRIANLTERLFPDQVAERIETLAQDGSSLDDEKTLPLFVGSLSFPNMPTFLHIYEPRYRLMIRRVMQNREYKFGMVTFNRTRRSQGDLGRTQFMQYGTVLLVDRFEMLPDGRSLVIATGVSRFRVTKSDVVDGYHVGKTERVDDISISEEERIEAMETSATVDLSSSGVNFAEMSLESMSTQQLLNLGLDFVQKQRNEKAPWLHPRVLMAYGDTPTDPVKFPWWFASVLPVSDDEKYALLSATSVRERLKITARWIRKLEAREWYVYSRLVISPKLFVILTIFLSKGRRGPLFCLSYD
ncbi:hypothetical protein AWENTII_005811 [Aspergillus wentii]